MDYNGICVGSRDCFRSLRSKYGSCWLKVLSFIQGFLAPMFVKVCTLPCLHNMVNRSPRNTDPESLAPMTIRNRHGTHKPSVF